MVKLLDCTIRDGGHLNNWEFSADTVYETYLTAARSGIQYFEIGYCNNMNNKDKGPFYNVTSKMLSDFPVVNNCKLSVMVDLGKSDLNELFKVDRAKRHDIVVRVATYPNNLKESFELSKKLFDMGYEVFLNLMAISRYSSNEYDLLKNNINKSCVSVLYFADSFGSLSPNDVKNIIKRLSCLGYKKLGFHSHNNLQLAFSNAIEAIRNGIDMIDITAYGMGRCAGNLSAEIFLEFLRKSGYGNYCANLYIDLIKKYYLDLHEKYNWGNCLTAFISGTFDIHPKYADLLKDLDSKQIFDKANWIKANCPVYFDVNSLKEICS